MGVVAVPHDAYISQLLLYHSVAHMSHCGNNVTVTEACLKLWSNRPPLFNLALGTSDIFSKINGCHKKQTSLKFFLTQNFFSLIIISPYETSKRLNQHLWVTGTQLNLVAIRLEPLKLLHMLKLRGHSFQPQKNPQI